MTDKIKHQSTEKESRDLFDNNALSQKEIAEVSKKADPRNASLFMEKLMNGKHVRKEGDFEKNSLDDSETKGAKSLPRPDQPQKEGDFEKNGFDDGEAKGTKSLPRPGQPQKEVYLPNRVGEWPKSNQRDISKPQWPNDPAATEIEIKDTSAISGAKILDNIQTQHIGLKINESAKVITNLAIQVAEKIIATNEALNARQEVRITLQDGVLKDTDVVISKEGKTLSVVFFTGSSDSVNLLRDNSDGLMRQLQNNVKDISYVEIEIEQQSASDNQNNDGRSRNRFDYQQQEDEENQNEQ
ncbi:MAG: hypothetical protein LBB16_02370 [Puniceicoccales bacterium]|jgi:hypothetical protein|nr:hypothetical protein [Puniceicoccales bacterium]